ncbi:hypothetical protein CDLVIII_0736 [Clostridium sp. DL-VIII]|uniref:hypothetical protein n=1 Tax=Clostridium sp. DL-VIII TaxID=641107 RepID=UPI00023AF827|nr:hypothetical protein [Clostridium sp. DL-VIII]EHI97461.1 hypothetical protein CDLVIII_0736 [Clostridium sp. DL-VIII]
MKISMAILMLLLSFFEIGAISGNVNSSQNALNSLELKARNVSVFEENGVKLQYKTKQDMQREIYRIKEYFIHNTEGDYEEINENQFEIFNHSYNINVKIWREDKYSYVEIVLINKNSEYSTINLRDMIQKVENKESEDVQYFSYYEGKNLSDGYSINKFLDENDLKNTELLGINNGYTGTGYLNGSYKINFALIRYNKVSHIIIGTPIIFTAY